MEIVPILLLAFAIVVGAILRAFGNVVGAGGNILDFFTEVKQSNKKVTHQSSVRKVLTSTGGVLFGALLLCPILYGHRINGRAFIDISPQTSNYVVGTLVVSEVLILISIWTIDRKSGKEGDR